MSELRQEIQQRANDDVTQHIPRVVVYGQIPYRIDPETGKRTGGHFSGAREVANALGEFLVANGMSDDGVVAVRQLDDIEDAFYRGWRRDRPAQANQEDTAPDAVFVFPEMRGYSYGGFSAPTPTAMIGEMCLQHDVPMFVFDEATQPDELEAALRQLPAIQQRSLESGSPEV